MYRLPVMARRAKIGVHGGPYHVIARGNGRRVIFHDDEEHRKFLSILGAEKSLRAFYLYAYCLMTNHFHLLIERGAGSIGQVIHRADASGADGLNAVL